MRTVRAGSALQAPPAAAPPPASSAGEAAPALKEAGGAARRTAWMQNWLEIGHMCLRLELRVKQSLNPE